MRISRIFLLGFVFFAFFVNSVFAAFNDVPFNHPSQVAIDYLYDDGVVQGYEDGSFGVFLDVSRAEFLKFVMRAFKVDVDSFSGNGPSFTMFFNDVGSVDWYFYYLYIAYLNGWVHGYEDGSFRGGNGVVSSEALKMLGEVAGWELVEGSFINWYDPYVLYASEHGILLTNLDNYNPSDIIDRTEIAEMTYRAMGDKYGFEVLPLKVEQFVDLDVDFYSQAPFGEWSDERQSEGCEEASILMAVNWANSQSVFSLEKVKETILAISKYEEDVLGTFHDTSLADTYTQIVLNYFEFYNADLRENVTVWDIVNELYDGNLVVVPINGQKVYNPNFTYPGPLQHMVLIKGYDPKTKEFIVHDPGTRNGENYRYSLKEMDMAINDYITGNLSYMPATDKRMIVFKKGSVFAMK